ncbi:carbohydrate kinase family protein [Nonomuraea sp. NPDC048901]|uniref:carbohydrate kinase family protein n=1 Tax=unclassified Nonomuraea TaxID=2593643 RepID=UPI0033C459B6
MSRISIIGNVGLDIIASSVDRLPPPGTEVVIDSISVRPGGGAGNTAMALAALGVRHELYGSLGDDAVAALVTDLLERAGADCSHILRTPKSPTSATIAVESQFRDRGFLTVEGHLRHFDRNILPDDALTADFVLLTGYFTTPALHGQPTEDMLRAVKANDGCTLFDPGSDPDGWKPGTVDRLRSLLPHVDVFLPNAQELSVIGGHSDPWAAARALHASSGGWIIAKLGPAGCIGVGPGEEFAVPARALPSTETTGAGDCFNAGLLYGLANHMSWVQGARLATIIATETTVRPSHDRHVRRSDLANLFRQHTDEFG